MIRLPPRSTLTDTLYTFTTLFLSLAKGRERLSSVLMVPLPSRVDAALLGASDRWPVRELAPPPAGSGLKPVLGTAGMRTEEHTSELQSLMRISYAAFCLKKKNTNSTYIRSIVLHHYTSNKTI